MTKRSFFKVQTHFVARIGISALLGLCLLPNLAQADEDRAPSSGRSAGGRGCGMSSPAAQAGVPALILLAPNQSPGQTTSTRPTFAWFIRDAEAVPMEFRIYEQEADRFKLIKEIKGDRLKSSPGIMLLSLDDSTSLTVGKRYRWQVELVCQASRPSGNPFAVADIEVVPLQSGLKNLLDQTRDRLAQAKLLDQANLWYDAIGALLRSTPVPPSKEFVSALLGKVALNSTEQTMLQNSTVHSVRP